MPARDLRRKLGAIGFTAFGALSAFVVAYVVYGHIASVVGMKEYALASYEAPLGSAGELARFHVTESGGLKHAIADGAVRVEGVAPPDGRASVRFTGPEQRLDDVVEARLGFRVVTPGAYDVFVGFERADQAPGADDSRRILAVVHVTKEGAPTYAITGDTTPNGARRLVARSSALTADAGLPSTDADAHTLALNFAAFSHGVFASIDGSPTGSESVVWFMGTKVRLIFGVETREPGAEVGIELREAGYIEHKRPATLAPFDERFQGRIIDPRRWTSALPDGAKAVSTSTIEHGVGLHIRGRSKGEAGFQPGLMLWSEPTPLGSFTAEAKFEVRELRGASFVLGVTGSGTSPARFVDAAVRGGDAEGKLLTLAAGHWTGDGQIHDVVFGPPPSKDVTIAIHYDAESGDIDVLSSGRPLMKRHFDLFPGDTTQLRVGAVLHSPDAVADVVLREVRFDR